MRHLIIMGPNGVGKTSVGKNLSEKLGLKHIDTDQVIIENEFLRSGKYLMISDIFFLKGEKEFRDLERNVLENLPLEPKVVLSLGGGFITTKANRELIKKRGDVLYLYASMEVLLKHIGKPPKYANESESEFKRILSEREPLYKEVADLSIEVCEESALQIAENILKSRVING